MSGTAGMDPVGAGDAGTATSGTSSGDKEASGPDESKSLPTKRPAETLSAVAGGVGVAVAQLFDVENAAIVSVLIALVGLMPALVTWLIEIGKKWDASPAAAGGDPAPELAYLQTKLLREAAITGVAPEARMKAVEAVRLGFASTAPAAPSPPNEPKPPDDGGAIADNTGDEGGSK